MPSTNPHIKFVKFSRCSGQRLKQGFLRLPFFSLPSLLFAFASVRNAPLLAFSPGVRVAPESTVNLAGDPKGNASARDRAALDTHQELISFYCQFLTSVHANGFFVLGVGGYC